MFNNLKKEKVYCSVNKQLYTFVVFKMESTRKLSNFNFQLAKPSTRIIYILHSFLHFSRAQDVISHL